MQVLTIREAVARAASEGIQISEYALRRWIKSGEVPARQAGNKTLVYYPILLDYLTFGALPEKRTRTE